jgi:hypothetical protein
VVPPAFGTDLHHVTDQLFLPPAELLELGRRRRTAAVRRQVRAENVGDVNQALFLADRADLVQAHPDVASSPDQLRVGIADIETREASLVELLYDGVSSKRILDSPAGSRGGEPT